MAENQHTRGASTEIPRDGCPSCMTRDNEAHATERPDPNTILGHYTCRACGQDWTCSWWQAVAANA